MIDPNEPGARRDLPDLPDLPDLFPYQLQTVHFLCRDQIDLYKEVNLLNISSEAGEADIIRVQMAAAKKGRGVIYADMGLGKTRIALETYRRLSQSPLVIVATRRAFNTWRRELTKWAVYKEEDIVFVDGSPTKRQYIWQSSHPVKVVSYQTAQRDLDYIVHHIRRQNVQMVIFDEAQNARNRKTKNFVVCNKLSQRVPYVLFLSGTLITRGPQDLWTYLHMCDPKRFPRWWNFIHAFCIIVETQFGQEIAGPRNTKALAKELARHVIRLRSGDPEVKGSRPPLTRDIIPIDPTSEQYKLHQQLIEEMYITREDGTILPALSAQVAILRVRQLMVCPKLLDPALDWGSNIEYLLDVLDEDPHIVIFTPFREAVTLMSQAISEKGHPKPLTLMGGNTPDDVRQVEEAFNSPTCKDTAFIGTIAFAESFELPSARFCYFNGFDWSQLTNYQAEGRLHRLTTPHPVNSYYLVSHNTIEEDVLHVLNRKQHNTQITMQDYIDVLKDRLVKQRGD